MASGTGDTHSADGSSAGRNRRGSRPYRKRHPLPAIALVTVLCLAAALIWFKVAADANSIDDNISCSPEPAPPENVTFTPQPRGSLRKTPPLPPDEIRIRVRNATNTVGKAHRATQKLHELGFTEVAKPANDPAYENHEADCTGQIRYGSHGKAAARTISLLDPCFELIRTNRQGSGVDLILGTDFRGIHLSDAARKVLEALRNADDGASRDGAAGQHAESGKGDATGKANANQGAEHLAAVTSSIDAGLLRKARSGVC